MHKNSKPACAGQNLQAAGEVEAALTPEGMLDFHIATPDDMAIEQLRGERLRMLKDLGSWSIPNGKDESTVPDDSSEPSESPDLLEAREQEQAGRFQWLINPVGDSSSQQLFDPAADRAVLEHQGVEFLRLCRALIMRLADPADALVAEAIAAFGPAVTAQLLVTGEGISQRVWDAGEPDPLLHEVLLERSPQYRPGEHSSDRAELEKGLASRHKRWARRALSLARECELAAACGVWLAIPEDVDYPYALNDLGPAAPYGLWAVGSRAKLEVLTEEHYRSIAFVGSRDASQYGQSVTAHLTAELVERGCIIISGGAYGVDIAAHRAALGVGAGRLPTVALMAGGLDHFYPMQNAATLRVIAHEGLVLSEVSIGYSPTRWRFLERNRLIAALAGHVVVAEARWRSGALNTAHHALELGRELWAVPGQIDAPNSVGCNRLLHDGHAQILTEVDDLVAAGSGFDAQREEDRAGGAADPLDALNEVQGRVWDALAPTTYRTVDEVAVRVGLSARVVMLELGALEHAGLAQTKGAGWRKVRAATG